MSYDKCMECGKLLLIDEVITNKCISCFLKRCERMEEEE